MLTQGIDYAEKYASTVRWNSIKMLIAIAVLHDYDIVLFDIAAFFLYGKLKEKVFMEQPKGWETEGNPREDYVCQLNRSMYGLPQSPHCAQSELKDTLTENDQFKATTADDCVYRIKTVTQRSEHMSMTCWASGMMLGCRKSPIPSRQNLRSP